MNFTCALVERGPRLPMPGVTATVDRNEHGKAVPFDRSLTAAGEFAASAGAQAAAATLNGRTGTTFAKLTTHATT